VLKFLPFTIAYDNKKAFIFHVEFLNLSDSTKVNRINNKFTRINSSATGIMMIKEFEPIVFGVSTLIDEWEPKLKGLSNDVITKRRNNQNRSIKQIVGHMIDSASNNTHRIVHLQYQESPYMFPNYATNGNNDRWIAIQNYQDEDWSELVNMWKFSNLHVIHVIKNINPTKLYNKWYCNDKETVTLKEMVTDYLRHFELHISEIDDLIRQAVNV